MKNKFNTLQDFFRSYLLNKKILLLLFIIPFTSLQAQVWQWSTSVKSDYSPISEAFLWVPEDCKQIKAVVFAQNNMEEFSILTSNVFRKEMAALDIAEIWVSPGFDLMFRFNENAGAYFNEMMNQLAEISGYEEIKYIPIIPIGHSAAASFPYYFAAWNPERTLAAISVSGQWPYVRNNFAPDIWTNEQHVDFIPLLETMGKYEAAATWSAEGLKQRQEHPHMALSMLSCPAEGHFATTEKKNEYLAFYIRKAMQYRYPKNYTPGKAPRLIPVDPVKTGWLAEKWIPDTKPAVNPAPVAEYKGDVAQAFWFFDEETVRKTLEYQSAYRNMKGQLVGYVQNGNLVPQRDSHSQVHFPLITGEDGITFHLQGTFLDTVPGESRRTSVWTGLPSGSPIGHAHNSIPVSVDLIIGPVKKLNDTTYQVAFERGMRERSGAYAVSFAAVHPGDDIYKPAVQQSEMLVPVRNEEGKDQAIFFNALEDVNVNTKSIRLHATSDSDMPVCFYIKEGPAELDGNELVFTKIPPGSKYPVKVTVVAWQYGRSIEPKVKTAESVERSFYIRKAQEFIHPGVLHTTKEMERMRQQVQEKEYPAYGSYLLLEEHKCSQADYKPEGPFQVISRDGEYRHTKSKMEADFSAAYQNALMWVITRRETHARKSLDILTAYANILTTIPETNDAPLLAGLEGFKIIYALEVLKYTYHKITDDELRNIIRMFKETFIPVLDNFYNRKPYTNGNWGPIVTKTYMAAAIFFDDREMYDKAKNFYLHVHDNGTIRHYISGETGQIQESGRDQGHCMLGIGAMATICELAWQQGDDLYAALDNRLLKGYEYAAKYNLGYDVPFRTWTDITGKYNNWTQISDVGRGKFIPVFEIVYNHYVSRRGLSMPYVEEVLQKIRPEGYDRDQPAFGTLLFYTPGP